MSLEDVLRGLQDDLAAQGELESAREVFELRTAAAAAAELVAALDRGDRSAAEFHSELLRRQVEEKDAMRFWSR